jgi:hypothetical protein
VGGKCGFGGKFLKMDTVPFRGFCSPVLKSFYYYPELFVIPYVKPIETYFALEPRPRTGTESQIYSQGKLTTLRCKNRKILHEKEI